MPMGKAGAGTGEGSRSTRTWSRGSCREFWPKGLRGKGAVRGFGCPWWKPRYRIWGGRNVQDSEVTFATASFIPSGNRNIEEAVGAGLLTRPEDGRK